MRNFAYVSGLLSVVVAACGGGPSALPTPPNLEVTSPARGTVQDGAGKVTVTGNVTPNEDGVPVSHVTVNNVDAVVGSDGAFQATIEVPAGATLIQTQAVDDKGGTANDTRVVEAGELRAPGSNIDRAITAAISKPAFHKIGGIASDLIKQQDMGALIAPMQPMLRSGDESGPDCLYAEGFVDDLTFDDAKIDLVPVAGGLQFSAEIDNIFVPGHANFAVACIDGSESFSLAATKITVTGQLSVTPNRDAGGFTTTLDNPQVTMEGFDLEAGGLAGDVIDMLNLDNAIGGIVASTAEKFMGPMMDKALAGLPASQQLNVLGQTIDLEVHPAEIQFDDNGGLVTLNTSFLIEGAQNSGGFIYTENGLPNMDPGDGLELGLADDLANEALAQITSLNMLNLNMPISGGTFDNIKLEATVPPMISADPADGQMVLILGDMKVTFLEGTTPVGEAALNAKVALSIAPAGSAGHQVSIQLGEPQIFVNVTNGVDNATRLDPDDLSKAVKLSLDNQISTISALLGSIPLPTIAGISISNVSVGADDGYVMVKGSL